MSLADLALPALRLLAPETAHRATLRALSLGIGLGRAPAHEPCLESTVFGLRFASPIGLAAGFDKDAEAAGGAFRLGFGFVEVGTLTPRPQPGNPRPRLFRLPEDKAVINRMGFNNAGAAAAAARLARLRQSARPGPLGVNIARNKDSKDAAADYAACARALARHADYLTINVSSPNTPGLRALQAPDSLRALVRAVTGAAREVGAAPPVLIKIAPDLEPADLEALAAVARDDAVAGLIISNTTIARPDGLRAASRGEAGGLSGKPLFGPSTDVLRRVYGLTGGTVPLIGVGGIAAAADAYAKIRAGASLVQLYSALVYEGPGLVRRIAGGLPALLRADGFERLAQAVGADHR